MCIDLCSVLCKFFMHGACLKGSDCMFSHNWSDQASQVSLQLMVMMCFE